ncbi:ABC transporter ATP-binding protein [soil metagenome]
MPAISLKGVSKRYRLYSSPQARVKEILSLGRKSYGDDFTALKDIDLTVEPGTTLGILGRNGAGKSTLLKIVSGVLTPTEGSVEVNGRLVLLQLGAGFNAEFTGRENVLLNGLILGVERNEMLRRFDEIEEFADLGKFMDRPVKTYSSGMRARLGFAVAVNVEPDILILDETLSVGDAIFKQVGLQKMRNLRDRGTTILFVSHSMGMVRNFCTEAILVHQGEIIARGGTSETADRYQALLSGKEASSRAKKEGSSGDYGVELDEESEILGEDDEPSFNEDPELSRGARASLRHGTGEARVAGVEVLDREGDPVAEVRAGDSVTVRAHLRYEAAVGGSVFSITLRNRTGLDIFTTDTNQERIPLRKRQQGERVIVDFDFEVPLQPGSYSVTAAISPPKSNNVYMDWVDVAAAFKISRPERGNIKGLVHLPTQARLHSPDSDEESGNIQHSSQSA